MTQMEIDKLAIFDFVLFGATGDLSMRKLIPALYFRHCEDQLPEQSRLICVARSKHSTAEFITRVEEEALPHIEKKEYVAEQWTAFLQRIAYLPVDATVSSDFDKLKDVLAGFEDRVRVFYLSTAPGIFARTCQQLKLAGLITPRSRVALEKPLGRDLEGYSTEPARTPIRQCVV